MWVINLRRITHILTAMFAANERLGLLDLP